MESSVQTLLKCLPCLSQPTAKIAINDYEIRKDAGYGYVNQKNMFYLDEKAQRTAEDTAGHVFSILQTTGNPARDLVPTVREISYQTASWKEHFAKAILSTVQNALSNGTIVLKGAMGEAYEKATRAAEGLPGFARDHPVWTTVIALVIALGILYLMMPVVLELLGFGLDGPIEGMCTVIWARFGTNN